MPHLALPAEQPPPALDDQRGIGWFLEQTRELSTQCQSRVEGHRKLARACRKVNGVLSYGLFVLATLTSAPVVVYIWQHDSGSKAWGIVSLACTLVVAILNGSIAKANYVKLQFEQQEAEQFFAAFELLVSINQSIYLMSLGATGTQQTRSSVQ